MSTNNLKIQRLGRRTEAKHRPIKIILRDENISISYDKTPREMDFYRQLKEAMNNRIMNGKRNLKIRHVHETPKIVKLN